MRALPPKLALALLLLLHPACAPEPLPGSITPAQAQAPPRPLPLPARPPPAPAPAPPAPPPYRTFETRILRDPDDPPHRLAVSGRPGAKIDLDVKSADLVDVCRLLADVGHVNIVLSDEVHTTVTVQMKRVPWDEALDFILRAKGLHAEREADIILVRAH